MASEKTENRKFKRYFWGNRKGTKEAAEGQAPNQRSQNEGFQAARRALPGTLYRSPKANSICERVIGTLRRECLDFLIPLTENHLCRLLKTWLGHYNHERSHSSLGSGIPDLPVGLPVTRQEHRHRIPGHLKVVSHPVLGGLHHEYELKTKIA